MAKDPNNSNNQNNPNEIGTSLSDRIADIGRAAYNVPAEERELRRKAKVANKGISIYDSIPVESRGYGPIEKLHKDNLQTISRTEPRIRVSTEARIDRFTQQAINEVGRTFNETSINGQVRDIASTQSGQLASAAHLNAPYTDLQSRSQTIQDSINSLRGRATTAAGSIFSKRGVNTSAQNELRDVDAQLQNKLKELAPINAAMRIQKQQGLDPESQMSRLALKSHEAQGMDGQEAKELVNAMKELKEAARAGATNLDDLQKKALEAAENLDKAQKAGTTNKGFSNATMTGLAVASTAFSAFSGAAMQVGVNQHLAQVNNATGYANFENQKYQTYKAAVGGDIASLMQLSHFAGADKFGTGLGDSAENALLAQTGGGAVNLISGISTAMSGKVGEGLSNVIGGGTNAYIATSDVLRHVTQEQSDVAGRNAAIELSRVVNETNAEQIQGFRDFSVGAGVAAIGMGGAGEGFLKNSITRGNLDKMTGARISPEQYNQMAQMGVANMGSMFNQDQIFAARGAESRGLGTMQENMQRMSSLASAGSNNPQASLAGVMEVALTKGLDSSKALNAVVDHTAQMAASSAGRSLGIDTTAAAATLLTTGITKDTPNKEATLERNASLQDAARGIGTNISTSYAGMVSIARAQRTLGVGGAQAVAAETIDTETLMSISQMGTDKEKRGAMRNLGVNSPNKDISGTLTQYLNDRQMKMIEAAGTGLAIGNAGNLLKSVNSTKSFAELTDEEQTNLADIGRLSPTRATGEQQYNILKGVKAQIDPNSATGNKALTMTDDKSMLSGLDKMRTEGFGRLSTSANTAADALDKVSGASGAIKRLEVAFDQLAKQIPNIEKSAGDAAGHAAAQDKNRGGIDLGNLNVTIGRLDSVLNKVLDRANVPRGTVDNREKTKAPGP